MMDDERKEIIQQFLKFSEIAGTSGAFASTPLIEVLKPVYATVLIPPLFIVASISNFIIILFYKSYFILDFFFEFCFDEVTYFIP